MANLHNARTADELRAEVVAKVAPSITMAAAVEFNATTEKTLFVDDILDGHNLRRTDGNRDLVESLLTELYATRIKLGENTDGRDARLYAKYAEAKRSGDMFQQHYILIRWQDATIKEGAAKYLAWSEGPTGFDKRKAKGVPGYTANL